MDELKCPYCQESDYLYVELSWSKSFPIDRDGNSKFPIDPEAIVSGEPHHMIYCDYCMIDLDCHFDWVDGKIIPVASCPNKVVSFKR